MRVMLTYNREEVEANLVKLAEADMDTRYKHDLIRDTYKSMHEALDGLVDEANFLGDDEDPDLRAEAEEVARDIQTMKQAISEYEELVKSKFSLDLAGSA